MLRILLILLCCRALAAGAQQPFTRDVWINEAGSPVRTNAIAMDSAGLMWLGTDAGLYTFNGREARPVHTGTKPTTAVTFQDHQLVYGCRDGSVYRYDAPNPRLLLRARSAISTICPVSLGLIIGTQGDGAYIFTKEGRTWRLDAARGLPDDYVYQMTIDGPGLLFGTDLGFYRALFDPLKGLRFSRCNNPDDIGTAILRTADRTCWFGFAEKGILAETAAGRLRWSADSMGAISDLLAAGSSGIWAATDRGWLLRQDLRQSDTIARREISVGKKINAMAADATGNLWLATSQGLTMVTSGYLRHLDIVPFAPGDLSAMTGDSAGNIYYTQAGSLLRIGPGSREPQMIWHARAPVNCLYTDAAQRIWIGTSGEGIKCLFPDGRVRPADLPELNDAHILSITGTGHTLWVSSLNGVEELTYTDQGAISRKRHYGKRNGIGSDYVYRIFIDSRGRVWFATDGAGLTMFDGSAYTRYGAAQGFSSDVVYGVTEDAAGNIWAGTLDGGLFRYNGRQWMHLGRKEGLQDGTVFSLAPDRTGKIFAVTAGGVSIWYPDDHEFRHINRRSGLGIEGTSSVLNAILSDSRGNVWIPYHSGLLFFSGGEPAGSIRPSVMIRDVSLFFKVLDTPQRQFAYDQNYLSFRFEGIHYAHGERLHYRYRLEGFNKDWIRTTDDIVIYPQLPPGKYRFCIQAALNDSFDHPAMAAYAFTITPPFWQRWWFWLPVSLALGGLVYALLRWRVRSLQRVARLQQERMLFEYEHLKSQVNPHFLFNSLNTLAALIEEDTESAVQYTVQLSDLYRDTLTFHARDLVPFRDEWAVLERYLFIQRSRFGDALQLEASIPPAVMDGAKLVPLALQLLVENAIKHNVVSRSAPLIIFIGVEGDELTIRNHIRLKAVPEKGTGLGLDNIRRRYARITRREVRWLERGDEFIVVLPLL